MAAQASIPAPGARRRSGLRRVLRTGAAAAVARLLHWHDTARQRRALLALSDHMLKDVGITRADAEREANRPFWQSGTDL
jgi:uncharacterized protein YjiS (DUF1127 family)